MMWALLLLAGFFALCWLMVRDINRQCERAQHDLDVDEAWGEEDVWV